MNGSHRRDTYAHGDRCIHRVLNTLGEGFLENVYVGALEHECQKRGLHVGREVPIAVQYDGRVVGTYRADLLIERQLILEVKSGEQHKEHQRQILNYLRATDIELGLLLYFSTRQSCGDSSYETR